MTQTVIAAGLLGPPEIRRQLSFSGEKPKPDATGNAFLDLMDSNFNSAGVNRPPMGFTENASPTFLTSGNPLLDFFFHVVPDTPAETITDLLSAAWGRDPLASLKLVFQLRGVRGTGKSDRKSFYAAARWLHLHHPQTLAFNVPSIAEFGYLKDLPAILHRLANAPVIQKQKASVNRLSGDESRDKKKSKKGAGNKSLPMEQRLAEELGLMKLESEAAAVLRRKMRSEMATHALNLYHRDPHYRFLHDRVSEHFAAMIAEDISNLSTGKLGEISLAAKWCPSLDSSFDRSTLLCEGIARVLFPRESEPELAAAEDAHYAYRIRDRLRRSLVSLREALQIPEVYMSAGRWDSLLYTRVPSVAMKNYKKPFKKHDGVRFDEYLENVKKGKTKIAAGALLPHEITKAVSCGEDDMVAELQWQRMVDDMLVKGSLQNCIAVCDVSGSMEGVPMEVCVALGLLVSELCEEPWKGRVITFSQNPKMHIIEGTTLKEKTEFVREMEWGMNTNFQKVFDKLLRVAVQGKLKPEAMVKRVLVFSDMEFDQAGGKGWETDYELICRKFQEEGYGEAVPEIVFWNLRNSIATPVPSNRAGVALVSGFSKNLLKVFFDGNGRISPLTVMEKAIAGEEYAKLRVID